MDKNKEKQTLIRE